MTVRRPYPTVAVAPLALAMCVAVSVGYGQEVPKDGKSWVGHAPAGVRDPNLPPDESVAKEQLTTSPRRSEWIEIETASGISLRTFIVHPQRDTKTGVAILLHEDSGLTEWARATADQLAKHGFIAVAPDLFSGKGPNSGGSESLAGKGAEIARAMAVDEMITRLNAVREYASKIPTGNGRVATVGIGWGGDMSFFYALTQPALHGAVSFHGATPSDPAVYVNPRVPILGLYGGADKKRIDEDVPLAYVTLGDLFTPHVYLAPPARFSASRSSAGICGPPRGRGQRWSRFFSGESGRRSPWSDLRPFLGVEYVERLHRCGSRRIPLSAITVAGRAVPLIGGATTFNRPAVRRRGPLTGDEWYDAAHGDDDDQQHATSSDENRHRCLLRRSPSVS